MNSLKHFQSLRYLATNACEVIEQVQATHRPVMITVNGEIQAVVQDIHGYQRLRDQIALLKILVFGKNAIEEGNVTDHDDFFAELEAEDQEEVGSKG